MPLHSHFRPPVSAMRLWQGFPSTRATTIVGDLNRRLSPGFVAIPLTTRGPKVEVDVAVREEARATRVKALSVWSPGRWTWP